MNQKQEKLKELREKRIENIKRLRQLVKEQKKISERIKQTLKEGPKTPVEISKSTNIPSHVVMWYVASLKKYGEVIEGDKKGEYYTYVLLKKEQPKS